MNIRKNILISVSAILSLFLIVFLFDFAFNIYTKYRMQNLPKMRVVLEVNIPLFLEGLAKNKDEPFHTIMDEIKAELKINPNQDVFELFEKKFSKKQIPMGRYYGSAYDSDNKIVARLRDLTTTAFDRDGEIIRNRLDQYGVFEPLIQKQNNWQLIVVFPLESTGNKNKESVRQLLQGTALLEFRLLKEPELTISVMQKIDETLAKTSALLQSGTPVVENGNKSSVENHISSTEEMSEEKFRKQHPFFAIALLDPQGRSSDAYVKVDDKNKLLLMLSRPEVQKVIPNNVEFVFSATPIGQQDDQDVYIMYLVNNEPELTGGIITDAQASINPNSSSPIVTMTMNSEGTTDWARITGINIGRRIAIMLDGVVYTAPIVRSKIAGGRSQIGGMANMEDAKLLEIVLKAGALPAPLNIISEEFIAAAK